MSADYDLRRGLVISDPRFADAPTNEASRAAAGLREALLDLGQPGVRVERLKEHSETMDYGHALALIVSALSAPAAVALARGIADWIRWQGVGSASARVVITTEKGSIVIEGTPNGRFDTEKLVEALRKPS